MSIDVDQLAGPFALVGTSLTRGFSIDAIFLPQANELST